MALSRQQSLGCDHVVLHDKAVSLVQAEKQIQYLHVKSRFIWQKLAGVRPGKGMKEVLSIVYMAAHDPQTWTFAMLPHVSTACMMAI